MSLDLLLKTGTILEILSADRKIPFLKELFISSESRKDIASLACFIVLLSKLFALMVLLVFKSWIISFT